MKIDFLFAADKLADKNGYEKAEAEKEQLEKLLDGVCSSSDGGDDDNDDDDVGGFVVLVVSLFSADENSPKYEEMSSNI